MAISEYSNQDYLSKMKHINECLGINDDFSIEKNKNIIFVYTPPKVGSTTLVSSIRLNASGKFTVLHLHNEIMLKILYKITDVSVLEIIKYNKFLGKNVYVIDIYRSPIEQKISTFFENICNRVIIQVRKKKVRMRNRSFCPDRIRNTVFSKTNGDFIIFKIKVYVIFYTALETIYYFDQFI